MLTPDWLDYQLDRLKISRDLEEGIIRDIARRITKTGYVTETADWQAERARQAGILREDVIRRVAASSKKSEREIRQLFKEAKLLIFDGSDAPTRGMNHIWNVALRKTCTTADNLTKTIAITSQKTYIEAADLAHMEIMSGAFTYDQAITNAIKKAAKDGAKVKYPSGAVANVETAVRRAVLTGVNQTSGKLCEMRCDELRCDLVEVSAHYGARPSHAEWQGGVYSRSGRHPEYESLVDATGYGTGEGLMGWNCNHSMAPFFEGMSKRNYTEEQLRDMREHTVTYNGKTMTDYEASQLQRGMERKIRHSRNKLTALDEQGKVSPSDKQKNAFAAESVRLKAREGKLRDFCKQTGRRTDAVRTRTASWNRSTSQKAVWANKKAYSNMSVASIKWPAEGTPITHEQYKEIRDYALERGIILKGFKKSDVDIALVKELIDDAEKMLTKYPELKDTKFSILRAPMNDADFASAVAVHNQIVLNSKALRDRRTFVQEYKKLVNEGWFVKGTNYHSVIYHEFGHLVGSKRNIDGMEVMKNVLGTTSNTEVLEFCDDRLSEYSSALKDGREIISEIFSAYEGGRNDEFILTFMRLCGILD